MVILVELRNYPRLFSMPLVVSLRFSKAVMSLQSRVGTVSIGITLPSEAGEEVVQDTEATSVLFLYILEPIRSPGNQEHY